jgi:hypothetical protein
LTGEALAREESFTAISAWGAFFSSLFDFLALSTISDSVTLLVTPGGDA